MLGEDEGGSSGTRKWSDHTNDTLVDDINPRIDRSIVIDDWSQTGRGFHVEFQYEETVPIEQGRFLGRGAMGEVTETTVKGRKLAHKKILIRRTISDKEKKEIEILKRLSSHRHMVQLVGTYTHRQFLGILLYPVAICDLHTFFEDIEAWSSTQAEPDTKDARLESLDAVHKNRLVALSYNFPQPKSRYNATLIYSQLGCLISAISYIHSQKIRHKDIKPSNILLSPGQLWLTDFGSATDFSLLSQSATDNERGTARYFSPEVAAWKPNGRASDIFSLGCVLLEIVVIHERGTLDHIRTNRSRDPSFHTNLSNINTWCLLLEPVSARRSHLMSEIQGMLTDDPRMRPTAEQLIIRLASHELSEMTNRRRSVFGDCCRRVLVPAQEHESDILSFKNKIQEQDYQIKQAESDIVNLATKHTRELVYQKREREAELNTQIKVHYKELKHQKKVHEEELEVMRHEITMFEKEVRRGEQQIQDSAVRFKKLEYETAVFKEQYLVLEIQKREAESEFRRREYEMKSEIGRVRQQFKEYKAREPKNDATEDGGLQSIPMNPIEVTQPWLGRFDDDEEGKFIGDEYYDNASGALKKKDPIEVTRPSLKSFDDEGNYIGYEYYYDKASGSIQKKGNPRFVTRSILATDSAGKENEGKSGRHLMSQTTSPQLIEKDTQQITNLELEETASTWPEGEREKQSGPQQEGKERNWRKLLKIKTIREQR